MSLQMLRVPMVVVVLIACVTAAHAAHAQMPPEPCKSPLVALVVRDPFQEIVLETWRRSITFRRQIARLAGEPALTVTVRLWMLGARPDSRALTTFTRQRERLTHADVQLKMTSTRAIVEIVAHELEHVLEQLDGVDLVRMDGRGGVAVSGPLGRPHAETKRAQLVGEIVAGEYDGQVAVAGSCLEAQR